MTGTVVVLNTEYTVIDKDMGGMEEVRSGKASGARMKALASVSGHIIHLWLSLS